MKLEIPPTPKTPYLCIDYDLSEIQLIGRLLPENPREWLKQVSIEIGKFLQVAKSSILLKIKLDYLNTSSTLLENFFKLFETRFGTYSEKFLCKWHYDYDDLEMLEVAEEYKSYIKLNIEIICDSEK